MSDNMDEPKFEVDVRLDEQELETLIWSLCGFIDGFKVVQDKLFGAADAQIKQCENLRDKLKQYRPSNFYGRV